MRLTGSRLPIARHCGWAFREDTTYPERPRGDDATAGDRIHRIIASDLMGNIRLGDVEPDDEKLVLQAHQFLADEGRTEVNQVRPEVTFAWDPTTGKARRLGIMLDRDYSDAKPGEIAGTVDYLVVYDDHVVVGDWKTFHHNATVASENAQLAFGALCAAQVYGVERARIEVVNLMPHKYEVDAHELERLDLMVWDGEFRRIVESLPNAEAKRNAHCTWCPALGACPESQKIVEVEGVEIQGFKFTTQALGLANDQAQVMHLPALKKAVDELEKSLKARYPGGVALPNGKVWKPIPTRKQQFNKDKAVELLGPRADECFYNTEYDTWRQVKDK